jgi:protein-S-isoprenylcysteine O-methyltransferase Ste14
MGSGKGLSGFVDRLRYHEFSRQGIGLLLIPVCAWFAVPGTGRASLGLALAAAGQLWRINAAGVIHKNRQLATNGAYALVRHPLYLGNALILGGFTLACGHWAVVAVVAGFFLFYYPAAIRYEDAKLEDIFGQEWRDWSRDTPAMFPLRLKWRAGSGLAWSARQSLLRNGELPISLYLLACGCVLVFRQG